MKERPIIFNAEQVRAVLDGRKKQHRIMLTGRHIKMIDAAASIGECHPLDSGCQDENSQSYYREWCPFGLPGDRLWVRETFGFSIRSIGGSPHRQLVFRESRPDAVHYYDCNGVPSPMKWTPSCQMPREYSRITLEITGVRVERLQDISEEDAWTECFEGYDDDVTGGRNGYSEFCEGWIEIHGKESWQTNPWVWVIEFKRVEAE